MNRETLETSIDCGRALDFSEYSEEDLQKAIDRKKVVLHLQTLHRPARAYVDELAEPLGLKSAQLYRIANRFHEHPDIVSLIGRKRGRKRGVPQIDPAVEYEITKIIDRLYNDKVRRDPFVIVRQVTAVCHVKGLKKPSDATIRQRIRMQDDWYVSLKREGYKYARDNLEGELEGSHIPEHVLECVMIDNSPADIMVVDEHTRECIGRPMMTTAIDIHSRCILAIILRMPAPSVMSAGLAVHMSSIPKDKYLADLELGHLSWPMRGIPRALSQDNGKEFHGNGFKFGCLLHNINIDHRMVASPRSGSIVERVIKTLNMEMHQLAGTTKTNSQDRGNYDSEKEAKLSLQDLKTHMARFITTRYHERVHDGMNISPRLAWELATEGEDPFRPKIRAPVDPTRMLIDFIDHAELPLTSRGFRWEHISYNSRDLVSLRNQYGNGPWIVKRDPRSIKQVFVYNKHAHPPEYLVVPTTDRNLQDMSKEEFSIRRKASIDFAESHVDYDLIHKNQIEADEFLQAAMAKTDKAKRIASRRKINEKSRRDLPITPMKPTDNRSKPKPAAPPIFTAEDLEYIHSVDTDDIDPMEETS